MAIASYRYSINKQLPLIPPARLPAVAVIPALAGILPNHWLILRCIKPLILRQKSAIFARGPSVQPLASATSLRLEERRVGTDGVSTCASWWSAAHIKKKHN